MHTRDVIGGSDLKSNAGNERKWRERESGKERKKENDKDYY